MVDNLFGQFDCKERHGGRVRERDTKGGWGSGREMKRGRGQGRERKMKGDREE